MREYLHDVRMVYCWQATVHLRVAFWSLLLPTTVAKRVSDIWRSYIAQALLYLQPDVCVMFSSICAAMKPDFEGESQTIIDLAEELPLYTQAAPVIQLIRNLPLRAGSFDSAFTSVYQTLYEAGLFFMISVDTDISKDCLFVVDDRGARSARCDECPSLDGVLEVPKHPDANLASKG
jgi:hypothetical protein